MAPSIRYATTSDGVRVAYAELGAGPEVVCLPPFPLSHLDEMWRLPGITHWYERLARSAHVVLYDARGSGLSDREGGAAADCSLEAMSRDLEAVIAAADLRTPALVAFFNSTPVALDYATRHLDTPAMVLWGGFARGLDVYPLLPPTPREAAVLEVQRDALVEAAARAWTASTEDARATAAYFRACTSAGTLLAYASSVRGWDVRPALAHIQARTLVLQRRDTAAQNPEVARVLAAALPRGELRLLAGDAASPFAGDIDGGVDALAAFLGLTSRISGGIGDAMPSTPALPESITPREVEVLALLARGLSNKEMAARLGLSVNTVERHLTNVYPKIGARGRTEATAFALRHGLA
ncbi:MAG: LuxR C-terminal-related transcriptional regulator [Dehalococcoidia bacterium]